MKKAIDSVSEMRKSLQRIEIEVAKLKKLSQGIPGVQKNIVPLLSFVDILKFHLGDLRKEGKKK